MLRDVASVNSDTYHIDLENVEAMEMAIDEFEDLYQGTVITNVLESFIQQVESWLNNFITTYVWI